MNAAGSIVAAAGLTPLLLGLDVRLRRLGLAVFAIGIALISSSLLATPIHHVHTTLTGHPAVGLAGAVVGIVGLVVAAAVDLPLAVAVPARGGGDGAGAGAVSRRQDRRQPARSALRRDRRGGGGHRV